MKKLSLTIGLLLISLTVPGAEEKLPPTLISQRGALLFSDDLNKLDTKAWHAAKGKWEIVQNALKGIELKEDKHGAVTRHAMSFTNAVIQFEVRLDGCRQATFSINDAKAHLARVLLNKDGFSMQKDDHDNAGPDKVFVFGKSPFPNSPGVWKTVVVEFQGNKMAATIGGKIISGTHPLLGTAKANFGFTVAGESASFRNLKVWEALPK